MTPRERLRAARKAEGTSLVDFIDSAYEGHFEEYTLARCATDIALVEAVMDWCEGGGLYREHTGQQRPYTYDENGDVLMAIDLLAKVERDP